MRIPVEQLLSGWDARAAAGQDDGPVEVPVMGSWEELVDHARGCERDGSLAGLDDDALEDELRRQAAQVAATMGRWLRLLREVLVRGVWVIDGARTPADWLSYTVGMAPSTAREHCRVALRLVFFPATRERLERGEISYSKARAITRVHDARLEALLLRYAEQGTGAQLEKIVAGFTASVDRLRAAQEPLAAWDRADLRTRTVDHQMTEIRVTVPTAEAEQAIAVIQASADAARRDARAAAKAAGQDPAPRPAGVERIEAFLTAIDLLAKAHPDDDSGADRTTLIIHVDAEQLAPPEPGQDHLEMVESVSGSHRRRAAMSVRTLRRLACDARYALIGHDPAPNAPPPRRVRLSQKTRASAGFRSAAETSARRGFVRYRPATEWRTRAISDGPTVLENLIVLCAYHHTFVHERDWTIIHDGNGHARFKPPTEPPLPTARPMTGADPAEARDWRRYDPDTLRARDGHPCDYNDAVQILHQELRLLRPPPQLATAA